MDMSDKDDILISKFFKEAALQQIEDNGFTDRVMERVEQASSDVVFITMLRSRRLCRLWTLFCVVAGVLLFLLLNGCQLVTTALASVPHMLLTALEVFLITAPTMEIPVNPWVLLLVMAFVLVFLPYQTYRKLSAAL